jgi:hypothetical protein
VFVVFVVLLLPVVDVLVAEVCLSAPLGEVDDEDDDKVDGRKCAVVSSLQVPV